MSQSSLTQTLWIGCAILQTLTLLRLRSQNLHREYPWFFAYTLFHVVRFTILFTIFHAAPFTWYFVGYWSTELVAAVFTFGVLYEIYGAVFSRYEGLVALGGVVFRWLAAILAIVAALSAGAATGSSMDRVLAGILSLDQAVTVVQVGLLLFLFSFAGYFRLSWCHYALGIAIGFTLFGSVDIVVTAMRLHAGTVASATYRLVHSAAYNCSVAVWLTYLLTSPRPVPRLDLPQHDLERWNRALTELLTA